MNKEEIVKLLMWLGDCYNMDNRESAEKCADEYISENEPKALNIDLVSKSFNVEDMMRSYEKGYNDCVNGNGMNYPKDVC